MVHWAQLTRSGRFAKYDFGMLKNLAIYGHISPPEYNVSAITTPVAFFTGGQDILADPYDLEILREKLQTGVIVFDENYPE